ncbi:2-succinyl-5-enolpyruvyl-6-hydroxy-3-cyclohexene- 1-carboxylate synthase [Sporosarcina sp. NCCP-2222]|uniref:2-succinyl-5-enolpyruvyl-6-hydroxy-3- cyclohexene-1-carboxylic-acid synthase n=1 Tax=Sporosarcina sp. NCCP-2222 TaxID=2935073 RepID=UPI002089AE96|nr:2-succinyl-5-enolpyruvyl-6-hydroxy-3-cyclohexene-1-carboxylic-acid synthase [Sporosarcina sp. NCCP-2222]GKV55914.1 2-succinyl-5-enolpyruvyl-6-hydroxy-3-cyclohexene- 1-carboxylate synthase [Sporosarcina sp. NCCP-2222]
MDRRAVLTTYVKRLTRLLVEAGVEQAVISPGSRSTPLAYAFASSKGMQTHLQIDERSAAYYALGLAKASGKPVILLCTSGTAVSNYHPAITEAFYARIPLIVLTADRPHELREVGAPQAIDQVDIYGKHVKFSVDFPLPEDNEEMDRFLDRHLNRAISAARTAPKGPVHINVPFREPLLIDFDQEEPKITYKHQIKGISSLPPESAEEIQTLLTGAERGLIIAGEMDTGLNKELFWRFAKALQWPVLCDPLSNLRAEVPVDCWELCIEHYDALLKSASFADRTMPEAVIRFGAQPISKPLSLYLKKARPAAYLAVDESPIFRDSIGVVTHHIQAAPEAVLELHIQKERSDYADIWSKANEVAGSFLKKYDIGIPGDEGAIAKILFEHLPDGADLFSGSSMPIRDVDTFFQKTEKDICIFSNRGTNGIDGVVSSAFGMQAARKRPAYLLIGDLSFLHDQNGLLVSRFQEYDVTIIVVNNDGGGIFSYLPQASVDNHFEELFGTPTGLTFEHIASMYDAQYAAVSSAEAFRSELEKMKMKPIRIIEVFTDRKANVEAHRAYWDSVQKELG